MVIGKSAQGIISTVMWVSYMVIISFVMVIYLVTVGLSSGMDVLRSDDKINFYSDSFADPSIQNEFFFMLESPVDGLDNVKVKDLLIKSREEDVVSWDLFGVYVKDFMYNEFLNQKTIGDLGVGDVKNAWFRVYEFDERIVKYSSESKEGLLYNYEITRERSYTDPCDPESISSVVIKMVIPENKLIALCVEYQND